ncbi:MAG: hypothetical protein AAFX54_16465 [Pseudomonadota bacterium]
MIFTKRVVAPIAFAWTLAAAGMAAVALTSGPDGAPRISLEDVQVGERGNQTRIALICDAPCVVEKLGAREFLLRGVDASMDVDLSTRTKNVAALLASPGEEGALLSVSTLAVIEYANTKNCTIGGRSAACIDLFFDLSSGATASVAPSAAATARAPQTLRESPALKDSQPSRSQVASAPKVARPALREGAPERMMVFAGLTPPERLSPPTGAILAKVQPAEQLATVQPIERKVEIKRPSIRQPEPMAPRRFDYSKRVSVILGKKLTASYCATADAMLRADAWALRAMVDAGLCAAARGDVEEADAMLARLLEYTPDNYEALVGRALIAIEAQEKSVARKYFQDALNALPPIEESNRIVEAMAAL